jgi:hypothetical protein
MKKSSDAAWKESQRQKARDWKERTGYNEKRKEQRRAAKGRDDN